MTYRVEFTTAAALQFHRLPRRVRDRLLNAIDGLGDDPRPHGANKLVGEKTAWRIRVGAYRVIFDVFDDALAVTTLRVVHTREAHSRYGPAVSGAALMGRSTGVGVRLPRPHTPT